MSIPVPLDRLAEEAGRFGSAAYLLTVTGDGRVHVVHVAPRFDGDRLLIDAGGGSARNVSDRPSVTLLWPPPEPAGMSLIVDGRAEVVGDGGPIALRP